MKFPKVYTEYIINKYIIDGGYSQIYKGIYNNKECIVKKINNDVYRSIEYEITSKTENKHNLLHSYNIYDESDHKSILFPFYKNGDLLDHINNNFPISEYEIKDYIYQILKSIYDLNHIGYVHLDIKLDNLFLDDEYKILLGDFGLANYLLENDNKLDLLNYKAGTSKYISPELYEDTYCNKSDVWSAGICLYMLLTNKPLYDNLNGYKHTNLFLENYSDGLNDLLNNTLQVDPIDRISCEDAIQHRCFM